MGCGCAVSFACVQGWPPAQALDAADVGRDFLYSSNRCQWAMLPKDFPPFTSVQYHFYRLRDCGVLDVINEALVAACRLVAGREAEPTAAIIDSQSVKTTDSGGDSSALTCRQTREEAVVRRSITHTATGGK